MRTKLRIVKLQNGTYEVQAKWRSWLDPFWLVVDGYSRIDTEEQAREYLGSLATAWSTAVVAIIEERTL